EVDGVADGAVVDEGDLEGVADPAAQDRAGRGAAEGPQLLPYAGGHFGDRLRDGEGPPVQPGAGRRGDGRELGVAGGEAGGGFGHRVEGLRGGAAVASVPGTAVAGVPGTAVGGSGAGCAAVVVRGAPVGPLTGDADREDHAHLAVADDGAPAGEVAADDPGVQGVPSAGEQPIGARAGLQHQVVGVGAGVVQPDHQAVPGGHVDRGG